MAASAAQLASPVLFVSDKTATRLKCGLFADSAEQERCDQDHKDGGRDEDEWIVAVFEEDEDRNRHTEDRGRDQDQQAGGDNGLSVESGEAGWRSRRACGGRPRRG